MHYMRDAVCDVARVKVNLYFYDRNAVILQVNIFFLFVWNGNFLYEFVCMYLCEPFSNEFIGTENFNVLAHHKLYYVRYGGI